MVYTISQISKTTGLSFQLIRFYEKEGILPPVSRRRGVRVYSQEDLDWIQFICCLHNTGMSLQELKEFGQLEMAGLQTTGERIDRLSRHKGRILQQLGTMQEQLNVIESRIHDYAHVYKRA